MDGSTVRGNLKEQIFGIGTSCIVNIISKASITFLLVLYPINEGNPDLCGQLLEHIMQTVLLRATSLDDEKSKKPEMKWVVVFGFLVHKATDLSE